MSNIKLYNPQEAFLELRKCNTVALCLQSETPVLATLKKEEGEKKVLTLISAWILDLNEFFNVQHKMKPGQIMQTASMLLDDFYYFRIADINMIFSNAKKGKFGALYGSLDGSKIYQWFEQHDLERADACYQENLRQHDLTKEYTPGRDRK